MGFIDRTQAEELLIGTRQDGGFLIRFSDSTPGALTISYAVESQGTFVADAWEPAGKEELKTSHLSNRTQTGIELTSGDTKFCSFVYYFNMNDGAEELCREDRATAFPAARRQGKSRA